MEIYLNWNLGAPANLATLLRTPLQLEKPVFYGIDRPLPDFSFEMSRQNTTANGLNIFLKN